MSDTPNGITTEVVLSVSEKLQKGYKEILLPKIAKEYNLDPSRFELVFDLSNDGNWRTDNQISVIRIICGSQMRWADPKQFAANLRSAFEVISSQKMLKSLAIVHYETNRKLNERYSEMYDKIRNKKLIPESRLRFSTIATFVLFDEVSKQTVAVTGRDGETFSELRREAHIRLSKKVLGE